MNIEKIEIKPGQYVWVDAEAKINVNDWMIREVMNFPVQAVVDFHWDFGVRYHKVIAASPSLNLEGVPDYVEWLAEQEADDAIFIDASIDYASYYKGVIKGYQTAEQEMFTEEDLKKAFACGKAYQSMYGDTALEQIIEQIKSEKK